MEQLKRLETGITGLDILLKGGLVAGASYIVQGRPGSGKTILANQMAFHHIRQGGRALVATLLSESHERLFQYLSTLSFFDPRYIGNDIQFVSAFDTLENEGLDEVVRLVRREMIRQKASVLIIDGLLNARSQAESPIDTKKFIAELQGHAAFAGCTVLFLTSSRLDDGSPEHTMVDGVIELGEELMGTRSVRRIQLRKTRGSGALSGLHECVIEDDGLVVYPRLETLYSHPSQLRETDMARQTSGVPALDRVTEGGLPRASVTLALGPSGVGKTTLGINFLSAATAEEPGLHFGFYETPDRLTLKAKALGHDFQAMRDAGALHIVWQPTTEGLLDGLGARLIALVDQYHIKRLVIDSFGGMIIPCNHPARLSGFFSALMGEMRARGVLVFATWEIRGLFGPEIDAPTPDLSSIVDNLLLMRFVEHQSELKRLLSVLKMRDSTYDTALFEVVINDQGLDLRTAFTHVESAWSGSASTIAKS
ncbi:ATPase domain-containing protein [Pseudomonas sp. dw_358]|uniref:ATPase domain-containing protein n=1 Tax=Pseudomonas sp. dw_358 TaxID=2720083 RepID=UPI0021166231|nr:ATPase domain-containing protein [Pseudomonas sp. dw_358]